jgi:hypothetical protein
MTNNTTSINHPAMKNILLLFSLILLPCFAFSQNRPLNQFYRQHKRGADIQHIKLPGWLIRFGGKIARNHAGNEEDKMAMDLLKNFGPVRLMYSEDGGNIPEKDIRKLRKDLMKYDFEDLIMIKDGGMNLQIMVEEQDNIIHNVFMLYHDSEDGEMVFLSARANMHLDDLSKLIHKAMEEKLEPIFDKEEENVVVEPML